MALRWSVSPECQNRTLPHSTDSQVELGQPQMPKKHTNSNLWQYSVWSYDVDSKPSLKPPGSIIHQEQVFPRNMPSANSASSSMMDKEGLTTLPRKRYGRILRNLRWTWFSVYRRLNLLVLLPNILAMVVLGVQNNLLSLSPAVITTAVATNITAGVLIRQELVINLLFTIFGKVPKSFPLAIRCLAAKIYHLGGVHSGAGVAATIWFALFNVVFIRAERQNELMRHQVGILVITIILDVLLLGILLLAHPGLRAKFHNTFEVVHRFAGWSAVLLFWIQFAVLSDIQRKAIDPKSGIQKIIITSPVFYLLLVVTVSLVLPWLRLRKVPVHAQPLSDHAIRLHFTYCNLPLCAAPRISDSPLLEWHAFAGIPEDNGTGFSIIVSKAGDWTTRLIRQPPTSIWVRGIPAKGVLHIAPIFKRAVLVATGSGIGPILSLLYARGLDCRILWSTPNPESTYQKDIIDRVLLADCNAIIINTSVSGRPDLVQESYNLYATSGAEAIFVISNPRVTRKIVYGLESRGVPTFAPIFDS